MYFCDFQQKKSSEPELKIADVPLHLRSWDKYYIEFLMGAGLLVYVVNFFIGRAKNNSIASTWYDVFSVMCQLTTTLESK